MAPHSLRVVSPLTLLSLLALAACSSGVEHAEPTPGLEVAWCRLQAPALLETSPGRAITATGRVRIPGLTELTTGPDLDAGVEAKLGWGPHGSVPTAPGSAGEWRWTGASAVQDWDGVAQGEPDVDEYRSSTSAPDVGRYDLAFAFSADEGESWTLCDLGGEPGADGSEDGYAPGTAGELLVRSNTDPCDPDPCAVTPVPTCEGDTIVLYTGPGTCTPSGTAAYTCDYPSELGTDCAPSQQVCFEGACRTPVTAQSCRHQGPDTASFAGDPIVFEGIVAATGITDRTGGVDADPALRAEFGFGWSGSQPSAGGWTWLDQEHGVSAAADWTDTERPGFDLYRAEFGGAPPGGYDTAWRFSADGGATWLYCDLDGNGEPDQTYDPAMAGHLFVAED